jgi:exonuclease I
MSKDPLVAELLSTPVPPRAAERVPAVIWPAVMAIGVEPAAVRRPCASTVKVDTELAEPNEPVVVLVLSRDTVILPVPLSSVLKPVPPMKVMVAPLV